MKRTSKFAAYLFMLGAGIFVFSGTNILYQAETQDIATVSMFIKIASIVGISMIVISLLIFGIITTLSGYDK